MALNVWDPAVKEHLWHSCLGAQHGILEAYSSEESSFSKLYLLVHLRVNKENDDALPKASL